jgi:D-alanyl-lipoteichoic acid acyltransferase DltB (MBOAT superfamily)
VSLNSWEFGLFFAGFYPVFLALRRTRLGLLWLLLGSYFFYGWLNPLYVLLILESTVVDYVAMWGLARAQRRTPWLLLSIANNLGLLGFFKYGAFVAENLTRLLAWLHVPYAVTAPGVLFPMGISFFVFRSLTYTIDCYRGQLSREPNFIRHAAFVAFFPELLMGPIDRAATLLPQLRAPPQITWNDLAEGGALFVVGLFKKVALADALAVYVNEVYAAPEKFAAPALMLATFAYAWQIYFDFSGYSDMARGIGRWFGLQLMLNFQNPYLATGLGDFWRRWHISLSTWFRDYVYIPLGGNRRGTFCMYVNMCLTMLISGLWHGAAWTFVIWGAIHAAGRVVTRALEGTVTYRERVPTLAKQLVTFLVVSFAWIFFRAESFGKACTVVGGICSFRWADPACPVVLLAAVLAVWLYQFAYESRWKKYLAEPAPVRIGLVVLMLAYLIVHLIVFPGGERQPFIYGKF